MRTKPSSLLNGVQVIPVLVIERIEDAVPLANCLIENGLPVLEITLRSEQALKAIEAIANSAEDAVLGVGSILDQQQLQDAQQAGGQFGVSPGVSQEMLPVLAESAWPFLPGISTVSECLSLRALGFSEQKLFPASILGGVPMLKALAGPVGDVTFCPTGGIRPETAPDFLNQSNVFAIGGTWIAPQDLVQDQNWQEIGRRAKLASQLGLGRDG